MASGWDSFTPDASAAPAPTGAWASFKPDSTPAPDTSGPAAAEMRRKAVEGGGTDMSDPLIENVAIGAGTVATGGLLGAAFVPKTLAGAALNAAKGTAEQYLYGWASEKASQYGTEVGGPGVGVAAGIAAPMVLGAGINKAGTAMSRLSSLPKSQEAAAKEAASAAEGKLYETAPKDIYDYGEKVAGAEQKGMSARQAAFKSARQRLAQRAADQEKALKAKSEAAAPQMAEEAQSKFFGRTPQESAAARTMPIEDLALHRANMRNATFGPINRLSEDLGKQFEVATQGQLHKQADNLDTLGKTITDENKWLNDRGAELSKPVRDLIKGMPNLDHDENMLQRVMEGNAAPAVNVRYRNAVDMATETLGREPTDAELKNYAAKALHGPSAYPTMGQLMGWRSEASRLVASQTDHNQVVAMRLREALDQTLMDNGVQIPKELREKWATYKSMFDHNFRRNVATAVNPVGYGRKLFENPDRAMTLIRGATPDEKQSLKQLMADYVRSAGMDPFKMGKRIQPEVLKELFGNTPYQNFKPWLETDAKALAWEHFRAGAPNVGGIMDQGLRDELHGIYVENAGEVRKAGIRLAQQLGPAGRGKLHAILSTRDPIAAAKIVEREFPIDPQQAQQLYQAAQATPGKAAFDHAMQSKALLSGLDVKATREQAAIGALMKDPSSQTMARLKNRLFAWHLPMLLGGAIGGGAGHSMGGYQLGAVGMIGGMMAGEKFRDLFRVALTDPEAARAYWQAIDSTPSVLNARRFGARMARVAVAAALRDRPKPGDEDQQ